MKGIKIDFVTNTITITNAFREAAMNYGSEEYTALALIQHDHPNMRIVTKTPRSSRKPSDTKGLTYKYMRNFIAIMDSANLITFESTCQYYDSLTNSQAEKYQGIKSWFIENYPNHKDMVVDSCPNRIVNIHPKPAAA